MQSERWLRIDALFAQALALPPATRHAFLERHCADDPGLLDELQQLLCAHDSPGILDRSFYPRGSPQPESSLGTGTRLGPWQIEALIGRGGMGEVYAADRADGAFEQRVALKLLRHEASGQLNRFHAERRFLARLEHPGIARLLDAGTTSDGRPYTVMEYVEGESLTAYCRNRRSNLRERLELFTQVCDAVAFAHRNLVIHRDLKPANILVASDGAVKLLDFGIAKLIDAAALPRDADITIAPFTPDYAAPEQLSGEAITTATDIYALGVLLFELLTGERPFHLHGLPTARALMLMDRDAPPVSRVAHATPDAPLPPRVLVGDVDAIVAKCLRKEPSRRFETVNGLKLDVERHLRGEPVLAREGVRLYVFGRQLRRYRWAVAAVLAVIVALAAGLAGTMWQARVARAQADRAEQQAARAEAVRQFLSGVFNQTNPDENRGAPISAHELLDKATQLLAQNKDDQPAVKADLTEFIASLYIGIGDRDRAESMLKDGMKGLRGVGIPVDIQVRSLLDLAAIDEIRGAFPAAREQLRSALELVHGAVNVDPLLISTIQQRRASIEAQADPKAAEAIVRDSLSFDLAHFGPDSAPVESDLETLGRVLSRLGRQDEAITALSQALSKARKLYGDEHTLIAHVLNALGNALQRNRDFPAAERALTESLAISIKLLGTDHPDTLQIESNLLLVLESEGRYRETLPRRLDNLARAKKALGDTHSVVGWDYNNIGLTQLELGMFADAQVSQSQARRIWIAIDGADSAELATVVQNIGRRLSVEGRYREAATALREALRIAHMHFPENSAVTRHCVIKLALALVGEGHTQEAIRLVEPLVDASQPASGNDRYLLILAQMALGEALLAEHQSEAASATAHAALAGARQQFPQGHFLLGAPLLLAGRTEAALGNGAAAESLLREAVAVMGAMYGPEDPRLLSANVALAEALAMRHQNDAVRALVSELVPPLASATLPFAIGLRARIGKL